MDNLRPDLYIAAIGRSGSTMLCNVLTCEPDQIVFIEPKFHTPPYRNMLMPQLLQYGMEISENQHKQAQGLAPLAMLDRLLGPQLRPIKWGFKEVQCSEHQRVLEAFDPTHILVSVRNIFNITLSFMEKHRRQGNEDLFPPSWVLDYCLRESLGLVQFCQHLSVTGHSFSIVRYEDFTQNPHFRATLEKALGWKFGDKSDRFMDGFNRTFEARRHKGRGFREPSVAERNLTQEHVGLARAIETRCAEYQHYFGYDTSNGTGGKEAP